MEQQWLAADESAISQIRHTSCPLPFGDVGAPMLPIAGTFAVLFQPLLLLSEILMVVDQDHGVDPGCGERQSTIDEEPSDQTIDRMNERAKANSQSEVRK